MRGCHLKSGGSTPPRGSVLHTDDQGSGMTTQCKVSGWGNPEFIVMPSLSVILMETV